MKKYIFSLLLILFSFNSLASGYISRNEGTSYGVSYGVIYSESQLIALARKAGFVWVGNPYFMFRDGRYSVLSFRPVSGSNCNSGSRYDSVTNTCKSPPQYCDSIEVKQKIAAGRVSCASGFSSTCDNQLQSFIPYCADDKPKPFDFKNPDGSSGTDSPAVNGQVDKNGNTPYVLDKNGNLIPNPAYNSGSSSSSASSGSGGENHPELGIINHVPDGYEKVCDGSHCFLKPKTDTPKSPVQNPISTPKPDTTKTQGSKPSYVAAPGTPYKSPFNTGKPVTSDNSGGPQQSSGQVSNPNDELKDSIDKLSSKICSPDDAKCIAKKKGSGLSTGLAGNILTFFNNSLDKSSDSESSTRLDAVNSAIAKKDIIDTSYVEQIRNKMLDSLGIHSGKCKDLSFGDGVHSLVIECKYTEQFRLIFGWVIYIFTAIIVFTTITEGVVPILPNLGSGSGSGSTSLTR